MLRCLLFVLGANSTISCWGSWRNCLAMRDNELFKIWLILWLQCDWLNSILFRNSGVGMGYRSAMLLEWKGARSIICIFPQKIENLFSKLIKKHFERFQRARFLTCQLSLRKWIFFFFVIVDSNFYTPLSFRETKNWRRLLELTCFSRYPMHLEYVSVRGVFLRLLIQCGLPVDVIYQ